MYVYLPTQGFKWGVRHGEVPPCTELNIRRTLHSYSTHKHDSIINQRSSMQPISQLLAGNQFKCQLILITGHFN